MSDLRPQHKMSKLVIISVSNRRGKHLQEEKESGYLILE